MRVDVFIAVGANIEADKNISRALCILMQRVEVTGVSIFYRCAALGRPEQAPFTNGVIRLVWRGTASDLKFDFLRVLEAELGRRRTGDRYANRPIDLDILLFGNQTISTADLTVPDPDLTARPFIYIPLLDLAPDIQIPGIGFLAHILTDSLLPSAVGLQPAVSLTNRLQAMWRESTGCRRFCHPG